MPEIALELLNQDHLRQYQTIRVANGKGSYKCVWDSKRPLLFVSRDQKGIPIEHGVIVVESLNAADLAPVYAKLAEVDEHGEHHLVR